MTDTQTTKQTTKNVLAFGGGIDSTALLAMHLNRNEAAKILGISRSQLDNELPDFDAVVFSDTGAEFNGTYTNIETARELCQKAGLHFEVVRKKGETITEWVTRLGIVPVMAGGPHVCSLKFKGEVMAAWAADEYGTEDSVRWTIGIEFDEGHRVTRFKQKGKTDSVFPLVNLEITRAKAAEIITALWPHEVVKSSCVFCPFMQEDEIKNLTKCAAEFEIAQKVEARFQEASAAKHQAFINGGRKLNKGGRAFKGQWRKDAYADGARLFARKINGRQLSVSEWAERVG